MKKLFITILINLAFLPILGFGATTFSSTLHPYQGDDTNCRNNATFIQTVLVTTGGWVYVSQTGDADPTTLTHTASTNTKVGFRVYRMADTLQSTNPVYMRVDWGSGATSSNFAFWITLGTGTDGSGNITGSVLAATQIVNASQLSSQTSNSYGSADTNRASIAMFIQNSNSGYPLVFTIERTKDSNGSDTGDGLLLAWNNNSSQFGNNRYLILAGGTQPSQETGMSYILTQKNPSESFAPGDIGVGVLIHFKGVAQQPGMNVMMTNSSDVSLEGAFSMTIYGASHTYQNLNILPPLKTLAGSTAADSSCRVNIRYE